MCQNTVPYMPLTARASWHQQAVSPITSVSNSEAGLRVQDQFLWTQLQSSSWGKIQSLAGTLQ